MSTREAYTLAVRHYRRESRRLIRLEEGANPWPFLTLARQIANHWDVGQRPGSWSDQWRRCTVGSLAGRRVLNGPTRSGQLFFRRLP